MNNSWNYFNTPESVKQQNDCAKKREAHGLEIRINESNQKLIKSLETPQEIKKQETYTKTRETSNFIGKPTSFNPTMK